MRHCDCVGSSGRGEFNFLYSNLETRERKRDLSIERYGFLLSNVIEVLYNGLRFSRNCDLEIFSKKPANQLEILFIVDRNVDLVSLSLALLQVFFERRSSRDGLAGILILVRFRITSICHASLSNLLEHDGGAGD